MLLIHAGVADSRMWDANVASLSNELRVVRYDMRGFGRSSLPSEKFSNVRDAIGVLDHLGVDRVHIVGLSFGALIAIDLVLAAPHRVGRLVLGAPSIRGEPPSKRIQAAWDEEQALPDSGHLAEAIEVNLRMWVDGPYRQPEQVNSAVREKVHMMQLAAFEVPEPAGDEVEEEEPDTPAFERLADIACETLVLCGSLDLNEKIQCSHSLAEQLPHATLKIVEGAGHMLNMERPDEFNALVSKFLSSP